LEIRPEIVALIWRLTAAFVRSGQSETSSVHLAEVESVLRRKGLFAFTLPSHGKGLGSVLLRTFPEGFEEVSFQSTAVYSPLVNGDLTVGIVRLSELLAPPIVIVGEELAD
jgi:hypothetical protein